MTVQRIALVSPYALSVFGGVQEQVLSMSRELARRGRDVLVVSPDASDQAHFDTTARVQRFGHLVSLPANGSKAPLTLSPVASAKARRAIRDFTPDLVHFHEPFAPLLGWATLRAHESAQLATFHRSGGGPAFTLTSPLLRRLARNIDVATAVSATAASTIEREVGVRAEVLFNGFETEQFTAIPRRREDEVTLVTVGRLEERKGTAYAIRAVLEHNARSSPAWRLIVIGDGPERAALVALAAGDQRIEFVGAVNDEVKRSWLRRAHAVIAPATRGESFGLVLLEAMASEAAVVASDISGYRDAAGGYAVLFEPANVTGLVSGIERALASESPLALEQARGYAERWSMRDLMDRYEKLYDQARRRFDEPR